MKHVDARGIIGNMSVEFGGEFIFPPGTPRSGRAAGHERKPDGSLMPADASEANLVPSWSVPVKSDSPLEL